MNRDQGRLVELLSRELEEGSLAIFAGAGFSRSAGFVDWKTLLKPIADDLDLDVEKEWDLVTLAQYHTNVNHTNRAKLNQLLVTEFSSNVAPTENHRILARLPISTYWTTNYDNLIESALESNGTIASCVGQNRMRTRIWPTSSIVSAKRSSSLVSCCVSGSRLPTWTSSGKSRKS